MFSYTHLDIYVHFEIETSYGFKISRNGHKFVKTPGLNDRCKAF